MLTAAPRGWAKHKISLQGRSRVDDVAVALLEAVRAANGKRRSLVEVISRYVSDVSAGPVTFKVGFAGRPLDALDQALRASDAQLKPDDEFLVLDGRGGRASGCSHRRTDRGSLGANAREPRARGHARR